MPASFDATRIILEQAISQLSQQDRQLIILSYYDELTSSEVAEIMDIPAGTVRVYLMWASEKLRQKLEGRENELFE